MELYVLFGHRIEQYEGQYGFEALGCMTEYDADENPSYMSELLEIYEGYSDFSALEIVTLIVDEDRIRKILYNDVNVKAEIKEE